MSRDDLPTSALRRFLKLGGLMGRVGVSVLGARAAELARLDASREIRRTENLVRNARRIVETLGEMKGAAMKVGQMLSLHEGLLPPEVAEVLRTLQKQARPVPSEVMLWEVEGSLGRSIDQVFEELSPEAFAAASIGQVHLGKLRDGRPVAVKIQYPLIAEVIRADLRNLKTLLGALFALVSEVDFEPVWREVRDRLLEELDYGHEAQNMRLIAELHRDVPEIVIPQVIEECSTRRVLTMEFLEGIPAERACSERYPRELRDRWGRALFEFQMRGLFEHRFLHADPNLANFSFLEDGRVIVYDFGCVKRIPAPIAAGYAELFLTALEGREEEIPDVLLRMGVFQGDRAPLPRDLTDAYVRLFSEVLRDKPPYTFGEDENLYRKLIDLGIANWSRAVDIRFPEDVVFIDRALAGHFGNLARLGATGPWRELVRKYAQGARNRAPTAR